MRRLRDWWHGVPTNGIGEGGFITCFCTGFLPHGRGTTATLRSADGRTGSLRVESRPRYSHPIDAVADVVLRDEDLLSLQRLIAMEAFGSHHALIMDGWRTHIRGFQRDRYWNKSFVIDHQRDPAVVVGALNALLDSLAIHCGGAVKLNA